MSQSAEIFANSFLTNSLLMAVPLRPHPISPTESAELACAARTRCGLRIKKLLAAPAVIQSRRVVWLFMFPPEALSVLRRTVTKGSGSSPTAEPRQVSEADKREKLSLP